MAKSQDKLELLRGVGPVLAARLAEAGLDSFAKISEAGEEAVRKIRGMNPLMASGIIAAATEMAGSSREEKQKRLAALREKIDLLKAQLQSDCMTVTEATSAAKDKQKKKIAKQLEKLLSLLNDFGGAENKINRRIRRLNKAEKHLQGLAEKAPEKIAQKLKKVRKVLQ